MRALVGDTPAAGVALVWGAACGRLGAGAGDSMTGLALGGLGAGAGQDMTGIVLGGLGAGAGGCAAVGWSASTVSRACSMVASV